MGFIEYYISYTGGNVGLSGYIRPNKHTEGACFLFALENDSETLSKNVQWSMGFLTLELMSRLGLGKKTALSPALIK